MTSNTTTTAQLPQVGHGVSPNDDAATETETATATMTDETPRELMTAETVDSATATTTPDSDAAEPISEDTSAFDWSRLDERPGPANPSPDGAHVAYLRPTNDGRWMLVVSDVTTGAARDLTLAFTPHPGVSHDGDTSGEEGPQWSPDGHRLALVGPHPRHGRPAVWLVMADTGESQLVVDHSASDRGPRWSPDGQWLVFTSNADGRDRIAIGAAETPSGEAAPAILLTDGFQDDRDPTWSRSGAEVAFRRRRLDDPTADDLWVISIATGEFRQATGRPGRVGLGSAAATRRTPRWSPEKDQVIYSSSEKDYDLLAVANTENGASWTMAGEAGDKADPRWSADGKKVAYTRALGPVVNCCVKATSAATAEVLDPGDGVAWGPRWLPDGRIVYWYTDARHEPVLIVQEAKGKGLVERTVVGHSPAPTATTTAATEAPKNGETAEDQKQPEDIDPKVILPAAIPDTVEPTVFELHTGDEVKLSGLVYRPTTPQTSNFGVVALGDGPPHRQELAVNPAAQRLAAQGLTVFAPNLRGTPGQSRGVVNGLRELADTEVEISDLADVSEKLRAELLDAPERLAIVGRGFGGTLALLAAGGRPEAYQAVAVIDPITDWDLEFDQMAAADRAWFLRTYGLPFTNQGRYALRTPATFVGVIDGPILLISTADASAGRAVQMATLGATLRELEVPFEHVTTPAGASDADVSDRIGEFLLGH